MFEWSQEDPWGSAAPHWRPGSSREQFLSCLYSILPFIFLLRNLLAEVSRNVREEEFLGAVWLIDWLCERIFAHGYPTERGSDGALGETLNGLRADLCSTTTASAEAEDQPEKKRSKDPLALTQYIFYISSADLPSSVFGQF